MTKQHLAALVVLTGLSSIANATILLNNQSEWQATASVYGANPLTTINLTTATYVNVNLPDPNGGDALTLSLYAPFEVTFGDDCGLCAGDPFPVVGNGSVSSPIDTRNALAITFGVPIYGLGGIFNVPAGSNPSDAVGTVAFAGSYGGDPDQDLTPGFDGFTSNTPFSGVFLFSNGCSNDSPNGTCSVLFDFRSSSFHCADA